MMDFMPPLRAARIDDAAILADLVNHAGEGLPLHLWSRQAGSEAEAWDIGRQRAMRDTGAFSWRNAVMIDVEDRPASCLIGYAIPQTPEPIPDDMPAMFRPMQELENLAPGSWYVNVLAVVPAHRGRGFGTQLLGAAHAMAGEGGHQALSIIVSDANAGARRLYARSGFTEIATRPIVKDDWVNEGRNWVLMSKPLEAA